MAKLSDVESNDKGESGGNKFILSKFEYDLYHEEDDIAEPVVRVKRMNMPNKGVKWKIMVDNVAVFVVEGTQVSKKDKIFLLTIEGFNFMINQAKAGVKSLHQFKKELKKQLKKIPVKK